MWVAVDKCGGPKRGTPPCRVGVQNFVGVRGRWWVPVEASRGSSWRCVGVHGRPISWIYVDTQVGVQRVAVLVAHVAHVWSPIIVEAAGCPCGHTWTTIVHLWWVPITRGWAGQNGRSHVSASMSITVGAPIFTPPCPLNFSRTGFASRQVFQKKFCPNA